MRRALASLFIIFLGGCGGSGGGSSQTALGANGGPGTAYIVLVVPAKTGSAKARTPSFIAPTAQSVSVSINGGAATSVSIASGSPACTNGAAGRTCTVSLAAPAGADSFAVTILNQAGVPLSTGTGSTTVSSGQSFNVPVTMNGVVASAAVTAGSVTPIVGLAAPIPITITAKDADGNTITSPGNYASALLLTDSDTSGATTLSTQSVAGPATSVSIAYSGARMTTAATIGITAQGVPASALTALQFKPLDTTGLDNGNTFTYSNTFSTLVSSNATARPGTSPSPTPTARTNTETKIRTIVAPTSIPGMSGLIAQQDADTYTNFAGIRTTHTENSYNQLLAAGNGAKLVQVYFAFSGSATCGTGIAPYTETIAYSPGAQIGVFPQTTGVAFNGLSANTQTFQYQYTTSWPFGTCFSPDTDTITQNVDGTSNEVLNYDPLASPNSPKTETIVVQTNGGTDNSTYSDGTTDNIAYSLAGSTLNVSETFTPPGGTATTTLSSVSNFPAFQYIDNYTVSTGVAIPSVCSVPASFGSTANVVAESFAGVQPAYAASYTGTSNTYYVSGIGLVCYTANQTTINYQWFRGPAIQQASTTNIVYTLQSEVVMSAARSPMSLAAMPAANPAMSELRGQMWQQMHQARIEASRERISALRSKR